VPISSEFVGQAAVPRSRRHRPVVSSYRANAVLTRWTTHAGRLRYHRATKAARSGPVPVANVNRGPTTTRWRSRATVRPVHHQSAARRGRRILRLGSAPTTVASHQETHRIFVFWRRGDCADPKCYRGRDRPYRVAGFTGCGVCQDRRSRGAVVGRSRRWDGVSGREFWILVAITIRR